MIWLLLLCIGIITYATRLSFIMLFGKIEMPPLLLRILHYVPMTVLTSIVLVQLFLPNNTLDLSLSNPRWLAGLIAAIVAWRTRNIFITILIGMVALWSLQLLLRL
jgi:branched-subunit amino acid transport protein